MESNNLKINKMGLEDYSIKKQKQIMHNEILGMLEIVKNNYKILDRVYWVLRDNEINENKQKQYEQHK